MLLFWPTFLASYSTAVKKIIFASVIVKKTSILNVSTYRGWDDWGSFGPLFAAYYIGMAWKGKGNILWKYTFVKNWRVENIYGFMKNAFWTWLTSEYRSILLCYVNINMSSYIIPCEHNFYVVSCHLMK